jgi:hypothetical protein
LRSELKRPSSAAILEQLEQGALARELDRFDHDLIARARRIGRDPAGDDDLHPVLGPERQVARRAAPADAVDHRLVVLEREIEMAGGGPLETRDLAPDPDMGELILKGPLERPADLADREFRQVMGRRSRRIVRHLRGHYDTAAPAGTTGRTRPRPESNRGARSPI